MGRRAKNKQGDPLPLHADPDLNGSSRLMSKPGLRTKPSASNLNAKLGKRKSERDDDGERANKKPRGSRSIGKSKTQTKAAPAKQPASKVKGKHTKANGKKVDLKGDEVLDDDGSVGWEDVDDVDMRAEARCVCLFGGVDILAQFTGFLPTGHYSTTAISPTRTPKVNMMKSLPDLPEAWKTWSATRMKQKSMFHGFSLYPTTLSR